MKNSNLNYYSQEIPRESYEFVKKEGKKSVYWNTIFAPQQEVTEICLSDPWKHSKTAK